MCKNEDDTMAVTVTFFATFQWSWNEWERVTSVSTGTFLHSLGPDFLT